MIRYIKQMSVNLFPGYFALVMATGALSIATFLLGMHLISRLLLYFNTVAYITLWCLTLFRLIRFTPRIIADLTSHTLGPGFFTLVAGTCVFGSQLITVAHHYSLALYLWFLGIILWIVVMYTFFTAVTVRKDKPTLAEGINGAWLIAAVATQSISVLGTLLSSHVENGREILLFFTLCMYLLGCMLYLNIITLIFYRFTFAELKIAALTPPYWINMGAVAITTLAGSTLMLHSQNWPFLGEVMPFLKGFTLFFWITGTWWIPLLFILMVWRHLYHHYPLKYDPQFWGMAFPLAMYTTSTYQLAKALNIPFLLVIPRFMVYIAIAAWLTVLIGLIHHLYLSFRAHRNTSSGQAFSWQRRGGGS
ncbi:tellurite resistance/C4-dicarboxylate transporter family protein [Geobacillus sp. 44B]|jgi:tellurite resistance protein TehA-like permease|uniref:tellurite resistance/C4-dicarboxylate transporter family protein n=1 Tax=Saccharococcus caldoxylosilyticus TaxID=81408 RepID=UPI0009BE9EE3|nr:tellurite resistance/C4-dicarboxylate transporter family protein [Parageobacillus caldoxylosilyticus]OQP03351.1 C4-dicarboxylate ABC transporter [Geobacillus sp. 44B]QNU38922.1 tellurite resistance/C4-dicarboxylate transporter family protein [Geobacillus sp. 44B]BDG45160.1 C4-dicarboxylate transporter [Parageobacillus caldoxylosilyticus]